MARSKRHSARLAIGKSQVRSEYLRELQDAWTSSRLVLFLGAGVSMPYGIPSWDELTLDILLAGPSDRFRRFWLHYRRALAEWFFQNYDFSPTTLARVVRYRLQKTLKNGDRDAARAEFANLVRKRLYRELNQGPGKPTALSAAVELIERSEHEGRRIRAVATFNFDDLLEKALAQRGILVDVCSGGIRSRGDKLHIYHVHGYLPQSDEPQFNSLREHNLIFSEDEYHLSSLSPFSGTTTDLVGLLRSATGLFIGLSMSDPNLRRWLDATRGTDRDLHHFLLRRDYDIPDNGIEQAKSQIQKRAAEIGRKLGADYRDKIKESVDLDAALLSVAKQAHTFDRELFKDLGVGTVWLKSYDDIPILLSKIPESSST